MFAQLLALPGWSHGWVLVTPLLDAAFSADVRLYRRTQALQLATAAFRSNALTSAAPRAELEAAAARVEQGVQQVSHGWGFIGCPVCFCSRLRSGDNIMLTRHLPLPPAPHSPATRRPLVAQFWCDNVCIVYCAKLNNCSEYLCTSTNSSVSFRLCHAQYSLMGAV